MHKPVLAVDIGGTNTKLALVGLEGNTGQVVSIPSSNEKGVDSFLADVASEARSLLDSLAEDKALGVGIGVAGFVDPAHTMMTFNPNLEWLEGAPLKGRTASGCWSCRSGQVLEGGWSLMAKCFGSRMNAWEILAM
jgi:predicted NBD/HSP70 family sugar kinase